jgi:hypothetical protein
VCCPSPAHKSAANVLPSSLKTVSARSPISIRISTIHWILGSTATLPGSVSDIWLLQPGVFRSGLFEDRAVIGVFPERKEIVVGGLGLIFVTRRMPRAA